MVQGDLAFKGKPTNSTPDRLSEGPHSWKHRYNHTERVWRTSFYMVFNKMSYDMDRAQRSLIEDFTICLIDLVF